MIEIIDCDQNTPEWHEARRGIVTASEFSSVMAKGEGKTRRSYMLKLAGEILTGEIEEGYSNAYMERGHAQEDEAADLYAFIHDVEPARVGFIRNGRVGCSPDRLIGDRGLLEIKTRKAALQVDLLDKDRFPPEHQAQTQGALWVADRDFIDLAVYSPKLPLYVARKGRDEAYIANLAEEIARFTDELDALVDKIRHIGANLLMAGE